MTQKIIIVLVSVLTLTGCLKDLAQSALYQNDYANKTPVSEVAPDPLRRIDISNADGSKTNIWYYRAPQIESPVLVYFHGNAMNNQSVHDSGFSEKMISWGVHFVIVDYPQYGHSTGELSEAGVLQASQNALDVAFRFFPRSEVVIWGRSLGAAPAAILSEKNQDKVDRLILTTPWNSFWKVIRSKGISEKQSKKAAKGNEYLSEVAAKKFAKPVLIQHGTEDGAIPYELGLDLFNKYASTHKVFRSKEGAGHNDLLDAEEWDIIQAFVFGR